MQSASSSPIEKSSSFSKSEVSPKGMERSESEAEQSSSSLFEVPNSESGVSTSSVEEGERWYGLLEKKIGSNINSRKWIEDHPELANKNKSELIIRLALELCLAKNTEYDPESDSVENEDGKCSTFDTKMIFALFEVVSEVIEESDRRRFVEFVCKSGNVKLLEMISKQENKDGGGQAKTDHQYSWKGEFTGYDRLTDLLQYVLKEKCSSEIVLCIAKKVYGTYHNVLSGREYLEDSTIQSMEERISQPNSVVEECLKTAIELCYKDVVQVMLSGDIYQCIRLMKGEKFQEGKKALDVIEETVAEVMSSLVNDERQSFKDDIQRLLKEGIEVAIKEMGKKELIAELEDQGGKLSRDDKRKKETLEKLMEGRGGKVRLSKTVVGSLISTLFFNHQNELMEKTFKIEISKQDENRRKKEIDELNKKIDSKSFVKEKALEKIKLLNSSSHFKSDWFFREVLEKIMNDEKRFNKLKAVCTAICKEKVEELLKDVEVGEEIMNVLEFFGVDPLVLDSSGSKAVEKKNKGFMQNNYRQGGESYYSVGTGSYLNMRNSYREVRMLYSTNLGGKPSQFSLRGEDSDLIVPDLPEISYLMKNHDTGYEKRLLDKIFDYDRIINHPYLQEDSSEGVSGTLGISMNQSRQLDSSSLGDKELAAIKAYKDGVGLLKLGREKEGKEEFKKAADDGFSHAGYVYAMMTFKEIAQHKMDNKSKLPKKGDINRAVQYMINVKREFSPFPSFVLGMMQSDDKIRNKIFVNKKLTAQVASARECFDDVLSGITYSEGKYSLALPSKCIVVGGESEEYLQLVVQSAKYELARIMLSCPEDLSRGRSLLRELSSGNFVDAKYLYALKLLRDNFGDPQKFEKENFGQAYTLLEEAINHGHKEAMFLFGTLPFREGFKILDKESQNEKGSCCFGYLRKYMETCGKDGKFTKDAAALIAAEYVKGKSPYVKYNEERARNVLRENDCLDELQELERKLQQRDNIVLPKVLHALEQVHSELKKNGEQSAQQLSSKVEELLGALQSSGLIIQQSERLSTTLKLLRIPSAAGEQYFLFSSLQHLCDVLESQVDSQSHKVVFSALQNLFSECIELQRERVLSQDLDLDKPSTALQVGHGGVSPIRSHERFSSPGASSTRMGDMESNNDSTLDGESISNSNKSHVEREMGRKGNSGYGRL